VIKTIEELKAEIIASNPSRKYIINDEEFTQTDAEFEDAVQKRAEYEHSILLKQAEQQEKEAALAAQKAAAEAKLAALGLTADDLKALGLG
jgi:hypothetical protein